MSNKVILAGGNFQDPEGNVLANGYLLMQLSQDAQSNQNTQISSGIKIYIQLDGAGNVITSPAQEVWGNDVLSPTGTYYTVAGYTEVGQLSWGPNVVLVSSTNSEFDVGSWVPSATNVNPGTTPTITEQQIILETNGVPNASQNTLNLIAGSNVTLTVETGGGVMITASGGGGGGGGGINVVTYSATPQFNLAIGSTQLITLAGNVTSSTTENGVNGQVYTFAIAQDSTGSRSFVWPSNFIGAGAIDSYDLTANANTVAVQSFVFLDSLGDAFYAVTPLVYNQAIP